MTSKSSMTAWERWELASIDEAPVVRTRAAPLQPPTPEEIEAIKRQARESGYQEGLAAGREAGLAQGQVEGAAAGKAAAAHLAALAGKLDSALGALDETVAADLQALALEVARMVVRQTIAIRPETLVGVVREALTQLPHQHAGIYLHPADASLLRSYAGDQLSHSGHRIHEDPALHRGDVVIESGGTHLDATLSARWRAVVESLGSTTPWIEEPPAS